MALNLAGYLQYQMTPYLFPSYFHISVLESYGTSRIVFLFMRGIFSDFKTPQCGLIYIHAHCWATLAIHDIGPQEHWS